MPVPRSARRIARATAVREGWPGCQVPAESFLMVLR